MKGIEIDDKDFTQKFFGAIAKHAGFSKSPKIDQKQFLSDIEKSINTFDSTVTPTEKSWRSVAATKSSSKQNIL